MVLVAVLVLVSVCSMPLGAQSSLKAETAPDIRALMDAFGARPSAPSSSHAGATRPARHVEVSLLAEHDVIRPGEPFWVAIRQQIAPGWHTYWQNPGDSGEPMRIAWRLPEGFAASDIHWPAPEAIPYAGMMNFGFEREAVMLVEITPPAAISADEVRLRARLDWVVCADICIPETGEVSARLAVAAPDEAVSPGAGAGLIDAARRDLPQILPWPAAFTVSADTISLILEDVTFDPERVSDLHFFPVRSGAIVNAAEQSRVHRGKDLVLSLRRAGQSQPPARLGGVLVISEAVGGTQLSRAFQIDAEPSRGPSLATAAPDLVATIGLWQALGFALLGGLILNLMPCVFPVLSLKAMRLAAMPPEHGAERRRHAASYLAGVMVSFGALAALLLVLRGAGEAFGWGFQFQSPVFVLAMATLFFMLGLSLSGVFSIGGSIMGTGDALTRREGLSGSFFTGVLASVAATPCTAPFMGAALGFALTQPAFEALLVLLALGLGFALPMTALTLSAILSRALPRPGPWMETAKQVLAFPLYATAAWLVWVLSVQAGDDGVLAAGIVLVGAAFSAWLLARTSGAGMVGRSASLGVLIAAFITAYPLLASTSLQPFERSAQPDEFSETFSAARLSQLRAEGRPVFVNFTAAWCITCKVNERMALSSSRFRGALKAGNIAYLKGDWTMQDPEITAMLDSFGHAGVPLYVLYPAGDGQPQILPQILTEAMVLERLDDASKSRSTVSSHAL